MMRADEYFQDGHEPVILTGDPVPERADWPEPETGETGESVHLRDYLAVIRSRKWSFLAGFATVFALVAAVTFSQTPTFTATTLLLIERRSPSLAKVDEASGNDSPTEYYRTQFELLRSRQVVEPVALALKVREREEFKDARDPVEAFVSGIRVEPVRESRLVRVSVDSRDPRFAMTASNAIVAELQEQNGRRVRGASDGVLKKLKEIEATLRPRYEVAVRSLQQSQQTREDSSMLPLDERQGPAAQRLRLLTEEVARARAERTRLAAAAATIDAVLSAGGDAGSLPAMDGSRVLDELKIQRARVESEREDLLRRFKPDHPQIQAIQARLARIDDRRKDEERSLIALARNRLAVAVAQEKKLTEPIADAEAGVAGLARKEVHVHVEMADGEAEAIATSYRDIERRVEGFEIAMAAGAADNNFVVIDRAFEPLAASKPRKEMNLALGALMGILCGLGLCFGREYFDRTVKDGAQVERLVGYPLLGQIPRVPRSAGPRRELAAIGNPRSALAESFRSIRAALEFGLPPGKRPAFVVTSAAAEDGKTFAGVNLAFAFAQMGRRVLLVDADLRRPRLHKVFELQGVDGLSTALGEPELTLKSVRRTRVACLDVMPAGPIPSNPAVLLGSDSMKALLDLALATYDCVILDAPCVVAVADVAILLAHGLQAVIVVRPLATRVDDLVDARRIINQAAERVAGVIVNMADSPRPERNGYGHGVDFGYSPKSRPAPAA